MHDESEHDQPVAANLLDRACTAVSAVDDRHLTIKALEMALKRLLDAHGTTCSMSRRANCYDNAVKVSFLE